MFDDDGEVLYSIQLVHDEGELGMLLTAWLVFAATGPNLTLQVLATIRLSRIRPIL